MTMKWQWVGVTFATSTGDLVCVLPRHLFLTSHIPTLKSRVWLLAGGMLLAVQIQMFSGLVLLFWFNIFLTVAECSLALFRSQWKWVYCYLMLMAVVFKWVQIINIIWPLHLLCLLLVLDVRVITTHLLGLIFETISIVITAWQVLIVFPFSSLGEVL